MKRIAVLQSNYIPWKGYFDIINSVDMFVIYDEAQFTRRDWRNRNLIKTKKGLKWITIPVEVKGRYHQKIIETKIADKTWAERHWKIIKYNYSAARCFKEYDRILEDSFQRVKDFEYLSDINRLFIDTINSILNIGTSILSSSDYDLSGDRNQKIISICKKLNADCYLTGPSAKDYIDERNFSDSGIRIEWMDYNGYREYKQLFPPFEHYVSILDLLFNEGEKARGYMKSFRLD